MRSAFALRIISGIVILNFAFVALCGALQTHFHGRGHGGKRQVYPFRLLTAFAATFPKGTASAVAGNFTALPKAVPLGKVA